MRDLSLRMFEVDVEIHIFKAWVFFGNVFLKELRIFSGWSTRDGQQGLNRWILSWLIVVKRMVQTMVNDG